MPDFRLRVRFFESSDWALQATEIKSSKINALSFMLSNTYFVMVTIEFFHLVRCNHLQMFYYGFK